MSFTMKKLLLLLLLVFSCDSFVQAQSRQCFVGTDVTVLLPEEFTEANDFTGFVSANNNIALVCSALSYSLDNSYDTFLEEYLKCKRLKMISSKKLQKGECKGILATTVPDDEEKKRLKCMAMFGDDKNTYLLTASFPANKPELSFAVKEIITSARIDRSISDPMKDLPYRISPLGDMKLAKITPTLMFTLSGALSARTAEPCFWSAVTTVELPAVADRKAFFESRLAKLTGGSEDNNEILPLAVNGLSGFEATVKNIKAKNRTLDRSFYLAVLFAPDACFILHGTVPAAEAGKYLPVFRNMARTFKQVNHAVILKSV